MRILWSPALAGSLRMVAAHGVLPGVVFAMVAEGRMFLFLLASPWLTQLSLRGSTPASEAVTANIFGQGAQEGFLEHPRVIRNHGITEQMRLEGPSGDHLVLVHPPACPRATWSFPAGISPCHSHWGRTAVPACSPAAFFLAS